MSDNLQPKLVCFGNGGDTVEYGKGCHGSGYGTPEKPHAADFSGKDVEVPDGTPVLDKRPAIATDEGFAWVFKGPMVNVDLPEGECDALGEVSPLFAGAVAENEYGALLAIQRIAGQDLQSVAVLMGFFILVAQRLMSNVTYLTSRRMVIGAALPSLHLIYQLLHDVPNREELDEGRQTHARALAGVLRDADRPTQILH